ncbi:MAG: cytochrome c oxidase accessory protein CcoG [Proteobacteria bacterium]|nr:cytochrome c oxidase accessory protein CcoG [Pseudomonadota bacterium]
MAKLFEAKKRLYPQNVKGRFRKIKSILNIVFLSIYLLFPLIRFDRGEGAPNQAILIDLSNGKAYFFGIEIWPQEVFYLAGILIIAAITLFFITSLFGRIWCGYACFQTVWTDIFIVIERFFQGDRNDRIILDRRNSFEKFWRKFATHICWILASLITGIGFASYFNDAFDLLKNLISLQIGFVALGWILGIAAATYIMAGFAREHVCTYMCPYSRFQSAMFDENTLIITYDKNRGEPRGKHKQGETFENRGDCIDCKQCVVVCPTGIDIRNGLQMECIACGLCVDACDNVMEKIGRPKGLIRYDTEKNLLNPSAKNKFRFFRFRTFYYCAILLIVSGLMIFSLATKSVLDANIVSDRNPMFVTLSNGSVRNGYAIKIMNKTHEKKTFELSISSPEEAEIKFQSFDQSSEKNIFVDHDSIETFKVYVILPKSFVEKNTEGRSLIDFVIKDKSSSEIKKLQAVFVSAE